MNLNKHFIKLNALQQTFIKTNINMTVWAFTFWYIRGSWDSLVVLEQLSPENTYTYIYKYFKKFSLKNWIMVSGLYHHIIAVEKLIPANQHLYLFQSNSMLKCWALGDQSDASWGICMKCCVRLLCIVSKYSPVFE